jgi:phosphate transport system substrate-binding protein
MAVTITGAGSTLVAPIEAEWANAWGAKTGNSVTYSAVGSGTGIKDISSRLVDFGASDAPMTPTQAITCHSCWQIPWARLADRQAEPGRASTQREDHPGVPQ